MATIKHNPRGFCKKCGEETMFDDEYHQCKIENKTYGANHYTEEQARIITQWRVIKEMKKDLDLFEQGRYLNDPRLLQIWNILNELETELKEIKRYELKEVKD